MKNELPKEKSIALKITLIYIVLGCLWILFSDSILTNFVKDQMLLIKLSIFKGWAFVFVTACILYSLIYRYLHAHRQSNIALQEAEEKYKSLVEESLVGVYLYQDNRYCYVNPRYAEIFGYTQDEIINHISHLDLFAPVDRERANEYIRQRIENEVKSVHYTFKGIRKDGKIIDCEALGTRTHYQGKPALIGTLMDITERKKVEESLQKNHDSYRQAIAQADAVPYQKDYLTDTFTFMGDGIKEITGYTTKELTTEVWKKGIMETVMREEAAGLSMKEAVRRTKNREINHWKADYLFKTKNGELRWISDSSIQLLDSEGKPVGSLGILQDITERKKAEKKFELFRSLLDQSIDTIEVVDPETGGFLDINEKGCNEHGYTREEFLKLKVPDIDPTFDASAFQKSIQDLKKSGIVRIESTHRRKDGTTFPVEINLKYVQLDRDYIVGVVRNITERKQSEQQLRQLSRVVEQSPVSIVITNIQGNIEYVNPKFTEVTGYTAEEVLGKNPRILKSDEKSSDEYKNLWETIIAGKEWRGEFHNKKKNGELYWEFASISPIRNAEGTITHFLAVKEDITERKRVEKDIALLYHAVSSVNECICITDSENNFLYVNDAFLKTYGYERDELIGKKTAILGLEKDPAQATEILEATIKGGWEGEVINFRKNGSPFPIFLSTSAIKDNKNRLIALIGVARDITEQKRAEERIQHQLEHITSLRTIDMAITGIVNLKMILNIVLDQLIAGLKVDAADILLFNQNSFELEYAASRGFRTSALQHTHLHIGESYAGQAAMERRVIYIPDLHQDMANFSHAQDFSEEKFISYYGVPLIAKGEVKGVLEIFHRESLEPTSEWLDFLDSLAGQASIAIDNANLFEKMQKSHNELSIAYDTTLEGWSHALDLRDKETEGHTQRVTEMTLKLARKLGISDAELVHLRRGALLHDIGKMGVPDNILLKPGALTEEEWVIMKKHPVYAYELLYPIPFLRKALDIPYCHHEKWDGSGYPNGLKRDEIPLSARIFAVIDVWDALTSDRPYRKAWSREKTREHILAGSGSHFDPRVVEAFLQMRNTDFELWNK